MFFLYHYCKTLWNIGCEVIPEVNIAKDKYHIKLRIPGPDIVEVELGCNSSEQYVKWMGACRLAAKGKTMADPSYDVEMSGVKTFLNMQSDSKMDETDYNLGEHVRFLVSLHFFCWTLESSNLKQNIYFLNFQVERSDE